MTIGALSRPRDPAADRLPTVLVWLATAASAGSFVHFYVLGLTTAFADAESRLMIARSVVDGLHTGLAQLGGIWLPVPQAAMLPFVWSDAMYASGVAGSLVSMTSYVVATLFVHRLVLAATADRWASVIGAAAFSSPSLLYMQSTPMSEMPFICLMVMSFYFVYRWAQRPDRLRWLFATSLAVFLATLTRYEGWILFGVTAVVVAYTCRRQKFGYKKSEGHLVFFGTLALFGIALWLLWNQVIFGDVLYFARSDYSPAGLIRQWQPAGTLLEDVRTKGNLALSLQIYGRTALDTAGWATAAIALAGLVRFALSRRRSELKLVGLALLFPFPFYVMSLFEGRNVLIMEHPSVTGGFLNLRYGTLMLPAVAFFAAYLAHRTFRWAQPLVLCVVVASAIVTWQGGIIALSEAVDNQANYGARGQVTASAWFRDNYDGGLILNQRNISERFVFFSGLPLRTFIYEGDQRFWDESLVDPARHAHWIVVRDDPRDRVWAALRGAPQLDAFRLVYFEQGILIYRRAAP